MFEFVSVDRDDGLHEIRPTGDVHGQHAGADLHLLLVWK